MSDKIKVVSKLSNWDCYLFGNNPKINEGKDGIVYTPSKRNVPNVFIRFMMKICIGCAWVKH